MRAWNADYSNVAQIQPPLLTLHPGPPPFLILYAFIFDLLYLTLIMPNFFLTWLDPRCGLSCLKLKTNKQTKNNKQQTTKTVEPHLKDMHNIADNSESPDDGEQTLIDITEHCFVSLHPL